MIELPSSLMAWRRKPNFSFENFSFQEKMSTALPPVVPTEVLPSGHVALSNGNVVSSSVISQTAAAANAAATPTQTISSSGNVLLSNGNTVNPQPSQQSAPSVPVAVVNSHVVMSNGNTVSPQHIANLPQQRSNSMRSNSPSNATMSAASIASNGNSSQCPIASPSPQMKYCRPAPFSSQSGLPYFLVSQAYGTPMVS